MANWAIVIGIDKYWRPEACLRGAVKDALAVREWLLDPQGGNVLSSNLSLLLEPDKTQPPSGMTWLPAKSDDIVTSIETMLARSGGRGERFFFHFSGHGLTARIDASNQSGIVASDFTHYLPDKTLTLWSLFELFQATSFNEQFFFVDACRNLPFETEKRLRDYPNPRSPSSPVSPQFVMYATMPSMKAIEVRQPGSEHGAFTDVLLGGLKGSASAKRWDEDSDTYVVRWDSLFKHVEEEVKKQKLTVAAGPNGPVIQIPRQYGEHGAENPILRTFPEADFQKGERLEIDLDPRSAGPVARLIVNDRGGTVKEQLPPSDPLPLAFSLPPRSYGVTAIAAGYVTRRRFVPVDLYSPQSVRIQLDPAPTPLGAGGPTAPSPSDRGGRDLFGSRGILVEVAPEAFGNESFRPITAPPPTALSVHSADRLADIEVTDAAGRSLGKGRGGTLHLSGLKPGFYRARLILPEGEVAEELIQLEAGQTEQMTLQSPSPQSRLVQDIATNLGFSQPADNTLSPSEAVGPVAGLKLSTILALAAAAQVETDSPYGQRLRRLGLPVPGFESGLQIVLGDESPEPQDWSQARLRVSRLGASSVEASRPVPLDRWRQIANAMYPLAPGPWMVYIQLADRPAMSLPVHVLPGRVSLIVMTRGAGFSLDVHQYMMLSAAGAAAAGTADSYFISQNRDPFFPDARFAAVRRIEWMQRSVEGGRITPTKPDVDLLLYDKWQDPIAGCLGGYLLIRMGETDKLAEASQNLIKHFGSLPDSHILRAAFLERRQPGGARDAYAAALERGLPVFRDGLVLLAAAAKHLRSGHPMLEALNRRLAHVPAGTLWNIDPETTVEL